MDLPDERASDISDIRPKVRHISISRRDTMLNDLKNSTVEGILSFVLSLGAFFLLIYAVYDSYRQGGEAGIEIGILPLISLVVAVISLILASVGRKNRKKIRHYMENRGTVVSIIVIVLVAAVLTAGLIGLL